MTVALQPRRPNRIRPSDAIRSFGVVGAALVATLLLFLVTPLDGPLGFVVIGFAIFVTLQYAIVRRIMDRKHAIDHIVTTVVYACATLTAMPLVLIVGTVVAKGLPGLSLNFFTKTLEGVDPSAGPKVGGALHAISAGLSDRVGTFHPGPSTGAEFVAPEIVVAASEAEAAEEPEIARFICPRRAGMA